MQQEQSEGPFQLVNVGQNELSGIVDDLHIQKYGGSMTVTFRLRYANSITEFSFPISLKYSMYELENDECPIKIGDWIKVKTTVERLEPNQ